MRGIFLAIILLFSPFTVYATGYDTYRWSASYYYGQTVSAPLIDVFILQWRRWPEHVQSLECSYILDKQNFLRRLFAPIVGVVALSEDTSVRYGSNEHVIYEFDPYLSFRWVHLPWNNVVNTSFAIGEGISYDTSIPSIEKRQNQGAKRLLNYLMFEATVANPYYARLQLLARIQHRSGAFGLYHAGNTGSNVVGLGVRYLF